MVQAWKATLWWKKESRLELAASMVRFDHYLAMIEQARGMGRQKCGASDVRSVWRFFIVPV